MARYDDSHYDCTRWSTRKLLHEIERVSSFEDFSVGFNRIPVTYREGWHEQVNSDQMPIEDFVREQTRLYRETWLQPLLAALTNRLVKEG